MSRTGYVDEIGPASVSGWAAPGEGEAHPAHVSIEINGRVVAQIEASGYRRDLEEHGICGGRCAFSFNPSAFLDQPSNRVEVRFAHSRDLLSNGAGDVALPTAGDAQLMSDAELLSAQARYSDFRPERLSYATVRDFCDSIDHLPALAGLAQDLKDVQRPWLFKSLLGLGRAPLRLLEIGAGQPFVADLMTRLGHHVTIVDPYDGSGNGPMEFEAFRKAHPAITFLRTLFTDTTTGLAPASFDCIYSISVLEHVPREALPSVFSGIRKFLKRGGHTIHAIDHVVLGPGQVQHFEQTAAALAELGVERAELQRLTDRLEHDPETYFLSAFGHHHWRGGRPYDEFPMRRCVSVNFCDAVGSRGE